jgi:hypothetical protein
MDEAIKLLKEALDLFGDLCSDAPIESDEWIWRWKVRYFIEDGLTPVASDAADGAPEHDG